jgi:hypothetical protein
MGTIVKALGLVLLMLSRRAQRAPACALLFLYDWAPFHIPWSLLNFFTGSFSRYSIYATRPNRRRMLWETGMPTRRPNMCVTPSAVWRRRKYYLIVKTEVSTEKWRLSGSDWPS